MVWEFKGMILYDVGLWARVHGDCLFCFDVGSSEGDLAVQFCVIIPLYSCLRA